mmetsp:Transcript_17227/g.15224  ORF Transcript_17227/g.15224 Transcript_17227/m.15224 type:complete len:95 (+) Transcript_17227:581-865(+)
MEISSSSSKPKNITSKNKLSLHKSKEINIEMSHSPSQIFKKVYNYTGSSKPSFPRLFNEYNPNNSENVYFDKIRRSQVIKNVRYKGNQKKLINL